jgi:hypothetical protein
VVPTEAVSEVPFWYAAELLLDVGMLKPEDAAMVDEAFMMEDEVLMIDEDVLLR